MAVNDVAAIPVAELFAQNVQGATVLFSGTLLVHIPQMLPRIAPPMLIGATSLIGNPTFPMAQRIGKPKRPLKAGYPNDTYSRGEEAHRFTR